MAKKVQICFAAGIVMGMMLLSGCSNASSGSFAAAENTVHTEIEIPKAAAEATEASATGSAERGGTPTEAAEVRQPQISAAEREKKTVKAYILETGEDTIYVDLKNPAKRAYDGEGENRKVAFDVGTAAFIDPAHGSVGESVEITYYEEDGKKIATKVTGDGVKRDVSYD